LKTKKQIDRRNWILAAGGMSSFTAAFLHIAIIAGGAEWYRFFGAGEKFAVMAEQGSWYPGVITFGIAAVLFVWGFYAFSGAGIARRLPFLKTVLVIVSTIYLVRGLIILPLCFIRPDVLDAFWLWSSIISAAIGFLYAAGIWQAREHLVVAG